MSEYNKMICQLNQINFTLSTSNDLTDSEIRNINAKINRIQETLFVKYGNLFILKI